MMSHKSPSGRGVGRFVLAAFIVVVTSCVPVTSGGTSNDYEPARSPGPYAYLQLGRDDGSVVALPDPDVVRDGRRWILSGTTGRGFEGWSSTDLSTWRYEGFIWRPRPGSWNDVGGFWAPDLHQNQDGTWILTYTAGQRIGIATGPTPLGPFREVVDHPLLGGGYGGVGDGIVVRTGDSTLDLVLNSDDAAIDSFLLDTTGGRRILYFSGSPVIGPTTIEAVELGPDLMPIGSPVVVLDAQVVSWEGIVREAPWVDEIDGRFHLTYSGSPFNTTCYAVGEAVSDNPLGPFVRSAAGPFLHDDQGIGLRGPGHHSITTGPDGDRLIFFHTLRNSGDRQTRWAPITRAADGTTQLVDPPGRVGRGRSSCWPFPL